MEDPRKNGTIPDGMLLSFSAVDAAGSSHRESVPMNTNKALPATLSKRDKKRSNIAGRLNKLELTFRNDRDIFYRNLLHELQNKLATLQQGTNEEFLGRKIRLEEVRDYELTKLRLWEEYQVKRIESEYQEDLDRAKEQHDKMIKLIKEKLYDKLQQQIKHLKEDKFLVNLVNGRSWNNPDDPSNQAFNAVALAELGTNDRRSLRKRELTGRFTVGEAAELSDGGGGTGAGSGENVSSHNNGGYSSAGKRRRVYATRYSSNDELSSGTTSGVVVNNSNSNSHSSAQRANGGTTSGYESNLSDKDYDTLNTLIMQNEDGGVSLSLVTKNGATSNKVQTRNSHKHFVGPQGLKPEELNEDLSLLRNAIVKKD
ncbi:Transcriptional regulatory protein SDS3 [Candida viswanathii]|uniref:Transcriptional regulatory protein SDS3 n=1 Tax=Candida viswanathii TaxID=5486 RepID=A0A367XYU3_9ASCO|nr:Transcriptional regulatory protein SDS3 [Candida viswanathii]